VQNYRAGVPVRTVLQRTLLMPLAAQLALPSSAAAAVAIRRLGLIEVWSRMHGFYSLADGAAWAAFVDAMLPACLMDKQSSRGVMGMKILSA